jgi:hypothetical protein
MLHYIVAFPNYIPQSYSVFFFKESEKEKKENGER